MRVGRLCGPELKVGHLCGPELCVGDPSVLELRGAIHGYSPVLDYKPNN